MQWRMKRLMVKAHMNFLRDMCTAPAARTKGESGMGGGRSAGRETERMAWRSIQEVATSSVRWETCFLQEGHAACLTDGVGEESSDGGAEGGEGDEEEDVGVGGAAKTMRRMSVTPGIGRGDEGAVNCGDGKQADEAEVAEELKDAVVHGVCLSSGGRGLDGEERRGARSVPEQRGPRPGWRGARWRV